MLEEIAEGGQFNFRQEICKFIADGSCVEAEVRINAGQYYLINVDF